MNGSRKSLRKVDSTVVVNAHGFVRSRADHTAFGETIGAGIGLRTSAQGFGIETPTKQGYGLTEKDDATGLNHTWFRKNENQAGRWTSPDPYNGSASIGDPQSLPALVTRSHLTDIHM